jgi:hypothetical protein
VVALIGELAINVVGGLIVLIITVLLFRHEPHIWLQRWLTAVSRQRGTTGAAPAPVRLRATDRIAGMMRSFLFLLIVWGGYVSLAYVGTEHEVHAAVRSGVGDTYLVAGYVQGLRSSSRDGFFAEYNLSSGAEIFSRRISAPSWSTFDGLVRTSERRYIAFGHAEIDGIRGWAALIAAFSRTGEQLWHRFVPIDNSGSFLKHGLEIPGRQVILIGRRNDTGSYKDRILYVRVSLVGEIRDIKTLGSDRDHEIASVVAGPPGYFYVAGTTSDAHHNPSNYLGLFSDEGEVKWETSLPTSLPFSRILAATEVPGEAGAIFIGGNMRPEDAELSIPWEAKVDATGTVVWQRHGNYAGGASVVKVTGPIMLPGRSAPALLFVGTSWTNGLASNWLELVDSHGTSLIHPVEFKSECRGSPVQLLQTGSNGDALLHFAYGCFMWVSPDGESKLASRIE